MVILSLIADFELPFVFSLKERRKIINSIKGMQLAPIQKFGLLISESNVQELEKLQGTHTIELLTNFDMNYDSKNKNRLKRSYYIITKKD